MRTSGRKIRSGERERAKCSYCGAVYDRRDLVREPGGLLRCPTEGDGRDAVTLTRDSVATAEAWARRKRRQIHDPGPLDSGIPTPIGRLPRPTEDVPLFSTVVVPSLTGAALTQIEPIVSIATFVDSIFLVDINEIVPSPLARSLTPGARSIYICLSTETILGSAPADARVLVSALRSHSEQSYALYGEIGGDIWIVGNNAMACRHGMYDYLERVGVHYLRPHPMYRILDADGFIELEMNELRVPTVNGFIWAGQGGLGSPSLPAGLPGRAASVDYWPAWRQQTRNPTEIYGGYTDGDEAFTADRYQELDGDHTMLAWVGGSINKRGYSETGNYPTGVCASMPVTLAKLCTTHHGASGAGSYPAAPPGPSPWIALSAAMWRETCVVMPPGGPITPDPGPDNATNPSPNYTAFNGLIKLHCEHHIGSISQRIVTYGPRHPYTRAFSVEPNDGIFFCQCSKCVNLLRSGPYSAYLTAVQMTQDASDTDKLAHIVNQNCLYAAHVFANATDENGLPFVPMCGALGYVSHTTPPSIPIHANSLWVILYTSAIYGGNLASEIFDLWKAKLAGNQFGNFTLGTYPQWLTDNTNFSAPKWPSPRIAGGLLRGWIDDGFHFISGETGYSAHVQALQIRLFSAMCWDPGVDIESFISEDLELTFGPSASAVQALYERWWQWYEHTPHEIALSMRGAQAAQDALDAAPDPVLPDGRDNGQRRLNDFKVFVEWQRRYAEYFAARYDYDRGKLTAGGGATADVRLAVNRNQASIIRIEIDGVGTFKWSKNADAATVVYEATGVAYVAGGAAVALGTDRSVTFPVGAYSVGHFWTEVPNIAVLQAATDRVLNWAWRGSSTNGIHSIRYAGGPSNGRIYNATPHPYSNSKAGTSPPTLTVLSQVAAGISPTADTGYLEFECVTLGALGVAQIRWRVNGGSWTTFTTPAASSTPVTLAAAGVKITCGTGPYAVDNRWYMTFDPNLGKWDYTNASAVAGGSGWAAMGEPTKAEMDTLVADGIATYTPVANVTRLVYDETSFRSFNTSAASTIHYGPFFQFPHRHAVRKPYGPVTFKVRIFGLSATPGIDVRVLLTDPDGVTLQEWEFPAPAVGFNTINDVIVGVTAGIAAGLYFITVIDCTATLTASRLGGPENVGMVLVNDWLDAPAAPTLAGNLTIPFYFYVPSGVTRVVGAFTQLAGEGPNIHSPIQVYNPSGVAVTMTYGSPNQFQFDVGPGLDNAAWSLTGFDAYDLTRLIYFENCPNRLAPSQYQLLIP